MTRENLRQSAPSMIALPESSKSSLVSVICFCKTTAKTDLFFVFFQNWIRRCIFGFGAGKFSSAHCHIQGKIHVAMKWFVHPGAVGHEEDCNFLTQLSATWPIACGRRSGRSSSDRGSWCESWPGTLCCDLGRDTKLSRCLSPPRCINGYRRI